MAAKQVRKLTRREKCVEIAKDAILWVRSRRNLGREGYLQSSNDLGIPSEVPILPAINDNQTPCGVCALGACLVGYVRKFSSASLVEARLSQNDTSCICREDITTILKPYFSATELRQIERAFEGWHSYDFDEESDDSIRRWQRIRSWKSRLIAILQNIVRNKGYFVITDVRKPLGRRKAAKTARKVAK